MRILLTNDDGIHADGLLALYQALRRRHAVTVCAPEAEQSAVGHAISLSRPLRVKDVRKNGRFYGYAVDGTPADCVKIAVRTILKQRPDLVVSGINHGPNLGSDVLYSGTVSAATEGVILGIPSLAFSLAAYGRLDFRVAAGIAAALVGRATRLHMPSGTLLNVNIPAVGRKKIRGIAVTTQGISCYAENFVRRTDPRGRVYYWLTGKARWRRKPEDSDITAIEDNYVSVTPLQFDLTDHAYRAQLRRAGLSVR
ncbi:MAG: 5'/3'-nucleotidase SurE [Candidatus Omnitrophica bacterium]|nr:5'/3'-nucleotidase SurE [Candidatus Omnitrophota bacterium]